MFGCHLLCGSLIVKSSGKHCKCNEGHRHRDAPLIEPSWVEAKTVLSHWDSDVTDSSKQFPNQFLWTGCKHDTRPVSQSNQIIMKLYLMRKKSLIFQI